MNNIWTSHCTALIIDVTSVISDKCKCKLYADNLKLYSEISVVDDCCVLQDVIDKVKLWSDEWQLSLSVRKCAAICVGHFTNSYLQVHTWSQ